MSVAKGENEYRVTTKDGCTEVVDEVTLMKLPQGMARLATLQTRELMAEKNNVADPGNGAVEKDTHSAAQSTVDEPAPPAHVTTPLNSLLPMT